LQLQHRGEGDSNQRGLLPEGNQGLQIVQIVGNQQTDKGEVRERSARAPLADEACEAAVLEASASSGQQLVRATYDYRRLQLTRFANGLQIAQVSTKTGDEADGSERIAWQALHDGR